MICFVAVFADALQLSYLAVEDGQGQIRPALQMLYVVDDHRLAVSAFSFAALALVPIHPKHLRPQAVWFPAPFRPGIEFMLPALSNQQPKLCQPIIRDHILTAQITQEVPDDRNRLPNYFMLPV